MLYKVRDRLAIRIAVLELGTIANCAYGLYFSGKYWSLSHNHFCYVSDDTMLVLPRPHVIQSQFTKLSVAILSPYCRHL